MRHEYRIGSWRIREPLNRIETADGRKEQIGPKAMAVLSVLASRPREVLSKETLIREVWPDQHVGDEVLTQAIYELRRAFGDDARQPQYIETIPRSGYRLIAPVEDAGLTAEAVPSAAAATTPTAGIQDVPAAADEAQVRPRKQRAGGSRWWLAGGLATVVALAALVWWIKSHQAPKNGNLIQVVVLPPEAASTAFPASLRARERGRVASWLRSNRLEVFLRDHLGDADIQVATTVVEREPLRLQIQVKDREDRSLLAQEVTEEYFRELCRQLRRTVELYGVGDEALVAGMEDTDAVSVEAYRSFEHARELVDGQQWQAAIAAAKKALTFDEDYAFPQEQLAHIYLVLGDTQRALEAIDRAIAASEHLPALQRYPFYRRRAQILNDVDAERQWLEAMELEAPEDPEIQLILGWFYFTHDRDCGKSLAHYEKALNGSAEALASVLNLKAEVQLSCGLPVEEAIRSVSRYVELRPQDPDAHVAAGNVLLLAGRYEEAQQAIDKALALSPEIFYYVYLAQGDLHLARGEGAEAKEAYGRYRARAVGRDDLQLYYFHEGFRLLTFGDFAAARKIADQAIEGDERTLRGRWLCGLSALEGGAVQEAEVILEDMRRLRAATASQYEAYYVDHLAGALHRHHGRHRETVAAFRDALAQHPLERAYFHAALGRAQHLAGEPEAAEASYRAGLAFNPQHAPSHCGLGMVYEAAGRDDAARQSFQRCLAIWPDTAPRPWSLTRTLQRSRLLPSLIASP